MVRPHAPGARPRRQGPELPQAGSRLVLPRARAPATTASRSPSGRSSGPAFDYLFPYYRDLTTCLAAGVTPEQILLNGMSKASDVASGGRHMSNHFARHDLYIWNVSSCVANHAQHAAGLGRAIRSYGMKSLVYCSMGESSTSEGYFYEAVNGCSLGEAPGHLRHPGQRLRHLGPEARSRRRTTTPRTTSRASRTSRSSTATARTSSTRSARCARPSTFAQSGAGLRPRPRRRACASTPTRTPTGTSSTATRRSSPRRASSTRSPASAASSSKGAPSPRRRSARSRTRTGRPTRSAADRARTRARPRPEVDPRLRPPRALGPRGGRPGDGRQDTGDRCRRPAAPGVVADPRDQRDDEGPLPREPGHLHLGSGRRLRRQGRDLQRHEGNGEGVREPPRLQRPDRRGLHPRDGRRLLARLRRREGHRRRGGVRRLLLAGGRADGRDVARVLADERPVRPERHRASRVGRLHRRRPLPLAEHRGVADDASRDPHRRPGLRRRRRRPPADRGPVARHHALPRAEVPLQLPALEDVRSRRLRGTVRQGAPPPRREGPHRSSRTERPSTGRSRLPATLAREGKERRGARPALPRPRSTSTPSPPP